MSIDFNDILFLFILVFIWYLRGEYMSLREDLTNLQIKCKNVAQPAKVDDYEDSSTNIPIDASNTFKTFVSNVNGISVKPAEIPEVPKPTAGATHYYWAPIPQNPPILPTPSV